MFAVLSLEPSSTMSSSNSHPGDVSERGEGPVAELRDDRLLVKSGRDNGQQPRLPAGRTSGGRGQDGDGGHLRGLYQIPPVGG